MPIKLLTRVDHNISNGIIRAMAEERITMVIAGWDVEEVHPDRTFGSVLDNFIEQTNEQILVSKLGHPLNTTKRIILILPKGIDYSVGFKEALSRIKMMANDLGAHLVCLVIDETGDKYEKYLNGVKTNPPMTIVDIPDWGTIYSDYLYFLKDDDLVVVLSAEKAPLPGTQSWR
ncbi:hypothetical protein ACE1TI_09210 [Alteribacillus sp. JSM 102045]|uniref:hypothetical protein n=1 Tax=Alteribacillus sp. JSM 102045 TaxID=1562101 RepID=UPI0035C25774